MKTVIVKPNLTFNSGNARMVLTQIGAGTITDCFDGSLLCELTDEQIRLFRLKGSMHQITVNEPPQGSTLDQAIERTATLQAQEQVAEWQETTGCATPEEFSATFNQLRADWASALADLNATISDWQRVTGVSCPDLFAEEDKPRAFREVEAKPKGK